MQDIIRKDILSVLDQAIAAVQAEDHHSLGELSNHIIHDASIFQDDDSVSVAVLIYALSKVTQRSCDERKSCAFLQPVLVQARDALAQARDDEYRANIRRLLEEIRKIDGQLRLYITQVLEKARVKKASKLHEHGISIARTAELLGVSQWELQDYIGKTTISEGGMGVRARDRLNMARGWFR
jgi:hypothetical protein